MTTNADEGLAGLLEDEEVAQLDDFGYAEAWVLGEWVIARAQRDALRIAVAVAVGVRNSKRRCGRAAVLEDVDVVGGDPR